MVLDLVPAPETESFLDFVRSFEQMKRKTEINEKIR